MNNNQIYDIGMHNGDDTAYFLSMGYKVLAVDASPKLVDDAKLRFRKSIENKQLVILNVGITDKEGFMDFYLNKKNSVWNSFDKSMGTREDADYEVIKIKTVNILQIISENGVPYYLKIDIEGYDISCLNSLMSCEEKPKYISAEVSDFEVILKLKELGYKKFKLVNQNCFLPMELPETKEYKTYMRQRAFILSKVFFVRVIRKLFGKNIHKYLEKRYKHHFIYPHQHGSSGPFGENLPGKWLSFDEVAKVHDTYRSMYIKSNGNKTYNFWIDIHATN